MFSHWPMKKKTPTVISRMPSRAVPELPRRAGVAAVPEVGGLAGSAGSAGSDGWDGSALIA